MGIVSAVWWNPFTWFDDDGNEIDYIANETIYTYTPSTVTACNGNICTKTLYSGTVYEDNGTAWKTITEIMGFEWTGNEFRLYYKKNPNIYVELQPFVNYVNGNNYTMQDIRDIFPSANIADRIDTSAFSYKFGINLTVPQNLVDNTNYIGFRLTDMNGLTGSDFVFENQGITIRDKYRIEYQDLIDSGFALSREGSTLKIGNLSANYKDGSLWLDPTIQLQDAETENLEDSMFDEDGTYSGNEDFVILDLVDGGGELPFIKFNISSLPNNVIITNSDFCVTTFAVSSSAPAEIWRVENQIWIEEDFNSMCGQSVVCDDIWNMFSNLSANSFVGTDSAGEIICSNITDLLEIENEIGNNNFSLVLNASDTNDIYYFKTKEYSTASERPYLNITYTIPDYIDIDFVPPTPPNGTTTSNTSVEINVSLTDADDLEEFVFNWNGTNQTLQIESWMGIGNYSFTNYTDPLLLLAYNFDNASALGESYSSSNSVIVDLSGTGNNGTTINSVGANLVDSLFGSTLNYSGVGSNHYVNAGNDASLRPTDAITVSAWIYSRDSGNNEVVNYRRDASPYFLYQISDTRFLVNLNKSGDDDYWRASSFNSELSENTWYHIVGVFSRADQTVISYVDGVLQDDFDTAFGDLPLHVSGSNLDNLYIGIGNPPTTRPFDGMVDEVRVWNRSLSADDVYDLYYYSLNKYDTDKWLFYTNKTGLTAGTYTYQAFAKDGADNWNQTDLRTLIKLTDLTVSIDYPTTITYTTNITTMNYTVSNSSVLDKCWYSKDAGATNSTSIEALTNFTGISDIEGSRTWTLYCNDSSSHTESDSVAFSSILSPIITVLSPSNTTYGTSTIYINATADQVVDGWLYDIDGVNYTININSSIIIPAGFYQLKLYANDTNGFWGLNDSIYFTIDLEDPSWEGNITNYTRGALNVQHNVTITDETNLSNYTFSFDNGTGIWVNDSSVNASGTSVIVSVTKEIVSTFGDTVQWVVYFWDNIGHLTITDILSYETQEKIPFLIEFVSPTPDDSVSSINSSITIKTSMTNYSTLGEVVYNWNGNNISFVNISNELTINFSEDNLLNYTFSNGTIDSGCKFGDWNIVGNYSCVDTDETLILAFNFDNVSVVGENDTLIYDISGNGFNGTVNGVTPAYLSDGMYNGAREYANANQFYNVTNLVEEIDGAFTVSFWMYSHANTNSIITKGASSRSGVANFDIFGEGTNMVFQARNSTRGNIFTETITYPSLNEWHYVVCKWDGTTNANGVKIYLDNELGASTTASATNIGSDFPLLIGGQGFSFGFDGYIDDLRIWNRSISDEEISQQYYSISDKLDSENWAHYINHTSNTYEFSTQNEDILFEKISFDEYSFSLNQSDYIEGDYTYQTCAKNSSDIWNCTEERTYSYDIVTSILTLNESTIIENNPTEINISGRVSYNDGLTNLSGEYVTIIVPANQNQSDIISLEIDSNNHTKFGLTYPVTYIFEIPSGSSDLKIYYDEDNSSRWKPMTEKTRDDVFSGLNAVRFNYSDNKAYISVKFEESDAMQLMIRDTNGNNINATYIEIPKYYDDNVMAVTITNDDLGGGASITPFNDMLTLCKNRGLWLTATTITGLAKNTWTDIQTMVDRDNLEICSHSVTHPSSPYGTEFNDSRTHIIGNLTLPDLYSNADGEFVPCWLSPKSQWTDAVDYPNASSAGYLGIVAGAWNLDYQNIYSNWSDTYGLYEYQNGYENAASFISFMEQYNSTTYPYMDDMFDTIYAAGGVYHLRGHPAWIEDLTENGWLADHLDHIGNRADVWYTGYGAMYMYHLVDEFNLTTVSYRNISYDDEFETIFVEIDDNQNYSYVHTFNLSQGTYNVTANYTVGDVISFETENFTVTADTAPTYSNNQTNSTVAGAIILHSLEWTDDTALTGYIFSFDNGTGTLVNDSFVAMTGTANWSNVTKSVNLTATTIQWCVYANDSSGNWNSSSCDTPFSYVTTDETDPTIDTILQYNESLIENGTVTQGDNVSFNITATDDVEVDKVWTVIWQGAIGGPYLAWIWLVNTVGDVWEGTVETNATDWDAGDTNYTIYTNNTSGNEVNESSNFTILSADTCSPTSPLSADYTFECSDNCTLSTNLDADGNNIYFNGTGFLMLEAYIQNQDTIYKDENCMLYVENGVGGIN